MDPFWYGIGLGFFAGGWIGIHLARGITEPESEKVPIKLIALVATVLAAIGFIPSIPISTEKIGIGLFLILAIALLLDTIRSTKGRRQ
ncbi:MAG: hypothetical protein ACYDEQ_13675 [Desulfocucumaceae bacterium]